MRSLIQTRAVRMFAALVVAGLVWSRPSDVAAQSTTVSVDMRQLDEETYERLDALNLEKNVVVRLVQEGFAVVAPGESPHIRVAYRRGDPLTIHVQSGEVAVDRDVAFSGQEDLEALHLEVAQKTVELVRQMPRPPAMEEGLAQEAPDPSTSAPALQTRAGPRYRRLQLEAMAGAVYRGEVDPQLALGVAYALDPSIGLSGTFALTPASSGDLDVMEWQAQAGVRWSPLAGSRWRIRVGVSAGVLVHQFSLPNESGTRADALVTFPVSLARSIADELRLGIDLAPGFADESREHTEGGQELWRRSSARVEILARLSWLP